MEKLNAKLGKRKEDVDRLANGQIRKLIDNLDKLISYLDGRKPDVARAIRDDPRLQLVLMDYDNQLHIGGLGSARPEPHTMLAYLCGHSGKSLTPDDIQNFINKTYWGLHHPAATKRRADDLKKALDDIGYGQSYPPRPAPNRFMDIIRKGLSDAYRSARDRFFPQPAPHRPVPSSVPRSTPPANQPTRRPGGDQPDHPVPVPSPFPPYTGAPRQEATDVPPGTGPVPYSEADVNRAPSNLPGGAGEGEWLWNEHTAPRPWAASQPSTGTDPSLLPFLPLRRNAFIPEPDRPAGLSEHPAPADTSGSEAADVKPRPLYSLKDKLDFLGNVYSLAKPVSERTGLSLPFLLSQASYETGWGKSLKGNSLFNLEADDTWQGPTATRNGKSVRAYPSYEESMKDYVDFLENTPRYGKIFETLTRENVDRLADAIQNTGYSEDPYYARGIAAFSSTPLMKHALWRFGHRPQEGAEE